MTLAVNIAQGGSNNVTFRNRIINGAMVIDQRNAGAAVTADGAYPVDRFTANEDTDGAYSAQRDTTVPAGFVNSLKWTTTTADSSLAAGQYSGIGHLIEGFNVADLGFGTASASAITLSFWVRSSLTGTFGGSFRNNANNRSYPFTYTISSANTFEYKTVTVAGDTSGTWLTDNGVGLKIFFGLGVGSTFSGTAGSWAGTNYLSATGAVSVIGTLNATFYITGVQLEAGTTASPFEYRQFGTELVLCQRYYEKNYDLNTAIGTASPSTSSYSRLALSPRYGSTSYGSIPYKVLKRTQPSVSFWSSGGAASLWDAYAVTNASTTLTPSYNDGGQYNLNISVGSSTSYDLIQGYWAASAEL